MSNRLDQLMSYYEADKNDPFIQFAIAKEYEKNNNLDQSLSWFEQLYNNHSDYIGLYYHLGKLLEKLDRITDAKRIYSEGLVVAKNKKDFHAASELNNAKMNIEI